MSMIANLQYGWTLFVNPIDEKFGWGRSAIQIAFTIFVLTETWFVPIEGYLVDKFGPRPVVCGGGILCGLGWIMNAHADALTMLYIAAAVSGVGAGAVYGTCVGNVLKWFPEPRGLAAGMTAAGFGAGSALTVIPIVKMIAADGYQNAFWYFGIGQGAIVVFLSRMLSKPVKSAITTVKSAIAKSRKDYTTIAMVKQPVFWIMYLMFVMVAAGGLMATARLGPIAKDFKIAGVTVSILGLALPALTFALTVDRVLNGLTRPFFGWVSDKIGREQTMTLCFSFECVGILGLYYFGQDPVMFVLLTGLVFFAWGEIYSFFPSTNADTFGSKFAAGNAGLRYTANGTASLLVLLFSVLAAVTGGWESVFWVAIILNGAAAILAWFVLRPMRRKLIESFSS